MMYFYMVRTTLRGILRTSNEVVNDLGTICVTGNIMESATLRTALWSSLNYIGAVTVQPEKGLSKVSKAKFHILHWSFFIPLFRYEFFISSIEDHAILNGFACLPYIIFGFHSPIHFWSDFTQLRRLKERAFKLSGVSPQPALQAVAFKELAFSLL